MVCTSISPPLDRTGLKAFLSYLPNTFFIGTMFENSGRWMPSDSPYSQLVALQYRATIAAFLHTKLIMNPRMTPGTEYIMD